MDAVVLLRCHCKLLSQTNLNGTCSSALVVVRRKSGVHTHLVTSIGYVCVDRSQAYFFAKKDKQDGFIEWYRNIDALYIIKKYMQVLVLPRTKDDKDN